MGGDVCVMKVGCKEYYPVYYSAEPEFQCDEIPDVPPVLWQAYLSALKDFDELLTQVNAWVRNH